MTLSIMTPSIMTLTIMKLSIMTQHNDTQHKGLIYDTAYATLSINDTQHDKTLPLRLELHFIWCYAKRRYAECRYSERR